MPETPGMTVVQGEMISFLTTLILPPGCATNSNIRVQLPKDERVRVLYGTVIKMPATMSSNLSLLSNGTEKDSNGDLVDDIMDFWFGDIVNPPGSDNTIVVEVLISVLGSTANTRGVKFSVSEIYTYINATRGFTMPSAAIGPFTLSETALSITKTVTPNTNRQAEDVLDYVITIRHTAASNAPAFGMIITDLLAPTLSLTDNITVSALGVNTGTSSLYIKFDTYMNGSAPIVITYQASLNYGTPAAAWVINEVDLLYFSAPPGTISADDVIGYPATSSAVVKTIASSGTFLLSSTSLAETSETDVALGETASFNFTIKFPYGTTQLVKLTMQTQTSTGTLNVIGAQVLHWQANFDSTAGYTAGSFINGTDTGNYGYNNSVEIDFANVRVVRNGLFPGDQYFQVLVHTRVLDVVKNANRVALYAVPSYTYSNGSTSFIPISSNLRRTLRVVVPAISLNKQVVMPSTVVMAGDSVQYTITVAHTTASTAVAYNLRVVDLLPRELALQPGTVSIVSGPAMCTFVSGTGANDTVIDVHCSPYFADSTRLVIKYNATLTTFVLPNSMVFNTATVTYYPSSWAQVRTLSSSASVKIATPTVDFYISETSIPETAGSLVAVGETVTFQTKFDLPLGTMPNTTVTILVPGARLTLLSAKVKVMPASMHSSTGLYNNLDVALSSPSAVEFDFGTVTNNPQNNVVSSIIVEATALVLVANARRDVFNSTTNLKYGNGTEVFVITANAGLTIVEPSLTINKYVSGAQELEAGELLEYTIVISHASASVSTSPAYEISFRDILPSQLELVSSSIRSNSGIYGVVLFFVCIILTTLYRCYLQLRCQ